MSGCRYSSGQSLKRTRTSLSRKLAIAVVVPVAAGTTLFAFANAWRDAGRFIQAKQREAQIVATVFGSTVADDLAGGDRQQALQSLRAVGQIPEVRFIDIRDAAGVSWIALGDGILIDNTEGGRLSQLASLVRGQPIEVTTPIIKTGKTIGSVSMIVETEKVRRDLQSGLWGTLSIAFGIAAGALLLSVRVQSRIINPIKKLTETMNSVTNRNDYTITVDRETNDETGVLVDAFNEMIDTIRDRDARLQESRDTLVQRVEERTRELSSAKDAAEAATKAKSEFLATMSHEIRTPMNGMMVMSEILAGAELPPRYRHYAELVVKSGSNLLTIINDILDYSKIEAGGMSIEKTEASPRQIVDDVLQLFWQQARSKGLDLAAYVAPEVPALIEGDPVRLAQVIGNLVNNALKFTDKGHVFVEIHGLATTDHDVRLEISVADTGIGISRENLTRIFESFAQADQSTTRKYGGTGLGLAICRKLVQAMGGEIEADAVEGAGTTFRFAIPARVLVQEPQPVPHDPALAAFVIVPASPSRDVLARALERFGIDVHVVAPGKTGGLPLENIRFVFARAATLAALPPLQEGQYGIVLTEIGDFSGDDLFRSGQAHDTLMLPLTSGNCAPVIERLIGGTPSGSGALDSTARPRHRRFRGLKVLVADDSAVNREVVAQALRQLEIEPDIVENGMQAVSKSRAKDYDIVFMDASMPDMDGFAAARHIRKAEATTGRSPVPIVALTAHMMGHIAGRIEESGMSGHLLKPFTLRSLTTAIEKWCQLPELTTQSENNGTGGATAVAGLGGMATAAIDRSALDNLREIAGPDSTAMVSRLYRIFREHAPPAMDTLAEACREGDRTRIATVAHALKSMCMNMAAMRLAAMVASIENKALASEGADYSALASEASNELEVAIAELDAMMNETALQAVAQA